MQAGPMPDVKAAAAAETGGLGTSPPLRFTVCPVDDVADDADKAALASAAVVDLPTPRASEPPSPSVQPPSQSAAVARRTLMSQLSRTSRMSESNRSNRSFQSNFSDLTCPSEDGVGILSLANDVNSILGSSILLSNLDYASACGDTAAGAESMSLDSGAQTLGSSPRDDVADDDRVDFGYKAAADGRGVGGSGHGAMVDLIDNPEYIDTLEGRLPLAEAAKMIARDSLVAAVGSGVVTPESVKRECYSKLLAVSVCFMFLYSAFFACRNLQTSVTADEALGQQTLAALYVLPWLGAVCGYPLMLVLRPSWAIVTSMLPCLLYVAANFYQAPYTLLPTALLQGLALGVMWAAEGAYMVNVAAVYAATFDESYYSVVARFNTIFYTIYQASCVIGNVVSSILLDQVGTPLAGSSASAPLPSHPANGSTPADAAAAAAVVAGGQLCGVSYTVLTNGSSSLHGTAGGLATVVDPKRHYTVLAVLGAFVGCGVLTAAVFLRSRHGDGARLEAVTASHLPLTKRKSGPVGRALRHSLVHLGRVLVDFRMLLVAPCICYLGFSGSLIYGDYSKAFISCQYGIGIVGYVYLVGAVFGVAGSFLSGLLSRKIGRMVTVSAAIAISGSCLLVVRFWEPEAHLTAVAFIPSVLWFFSDAIISSLLNALLGVLFKERLLAACAAFLLFFGVGMVLGALGSAFAWLAIAGKTYVAAALLVAGLAGYIVLELLIRRASLLERP